MISSVYANIAGRSYNTGFHVTTPDVFPLYRFLRQSVDARDEYFVLETTSHALAQNRVSLIRYEAAVITNVTHEHLDFHKVYEDYVKSKKILLQKSKIALLNVDDNSFLYLRKLRQKKYYTYGLRNKADYQIDIRKKLNLNLTRFNNYNYLAAYALCKLLGVPEVYIFEAIKTFKLPPGRLEVIAKVPITVIIDFAHTPNAFHHVLGEVKERFLSSGGRMIHVFGAAAKRDAAKRPMMGEESGEYSSLVILTEEDYRDEDPHKIANEIKSGLLKKNFREISDEDFGSKTKTFIVINDRKKAIEKAIQIAQRGDVVITTGKGHEKSLARGNKEYHWDEKKAIMEALSKFSKS
ncbi:hypothetical protein HYW87_00600 [Candidatus Roizmanbacteria bacterium]|nr:hypothetical protein [Candidatus Roizmanbacteria bacterium]